MRILPSRGLRLRYQRLSGLTRQLLDTEGESGRFEFKRDAEAVRSTVLVAAANAAAIEDLEQVTVLVGVAEKQDTTTGVVTGEVIGLDDIERARGKITSRGSSTKPVPVDLTVFEENLATSKPILRVEVRPVRAPHYSDAGLRVTRYEASTRAITDDELVGMYLQREADAFEARFRRTAAAITEEVQLIGSGIGSLDRAIEQADERLTDLHRTADEAAAAAEEGRDFVTSIDESIGHLQEALEDIRQGPDTFEEAWWGLFRARTIGWTAFRLMKDRLGIKASKAESILEEVLAERPSPFEYERNMRETEAWFELTSLVDVKGARPRVKDLVSAADTIRHATKELSLDELELQLEALRRRRIDPIRSNERKVSAGSVYRHE